MKFNFGPDVTEQFIAGDCWKLAWYLYHLVPNSSLVYVTVQESEYEWNHIVVKLDDLGLYVDVEGVHTRDELMDRWDAVSLTILHPNNIRTYRMYQDHIFCDDPACHYTKTYVPPPSMAVTIRDILDDNGYLDSIVPGFGPRYVTGKTPVIV